MVVDIGVVIRKYHTTIIECVIVLYVLRLTPSFQRTLILAPFFNSISIKVYIKPNCVSTITVSWQVMAALSGVTGNYSAKQNYDKNKVAQDGILTYRINSSSDLRTVCSTKNIKNETYHWNYIQFKTIWFPVVGDR